MIDTHCHIFKQYYENIDEIIKNMNGNIMIVSATCKSDIEEVLDLCDKYPNVYGTIGIHPNEVMKESEFFLLELEEKAKHNKIVAIGEIGLDYFYDTDKNIQKTFLIKQLEIAKRINKPVVIHSRDAILDTYNILKEYPTVNGVLHCFSSSLEMAKKFTQIGYKIGIAGTITFKNNEKTKEVVKGLDLSNLLIETDSPYLTPEPFRGKKNEPKYVYYVAECISKIKEIEVEEVLKITTSNAIIQFDLPYKI